MGNVNVKIRLGNYCETLTEKFQFFDSFRSKWSIVNGE